MAMIKDPQGSNTNVHIDLTLAKDLLCENCENNNFKQTMIIKKMSALTSPSGKEMVIPISVFACEKCEHVNEEFLKMETGDIG
mgnify:CR=1 FL=1